MPRPRKASILTRRLVGLKTGRDKKKPEVLESSAVLNGHLKGRGEGETHMRVRGEVPGRARVKVSESRARSSG